MRLAPIIVAVAGVTAAAPAFAQLIPPSRQYTSSPPTELDKTYGLPAFGTPDAMRQKTQAPRAKAEPPPDAFRPTQPLQGFATPDPNASDSSPDVPDFFAGGPDLSLPVAGKAGSDSDTPLYTTNDGGTAAPDQYETGDSTMTPPKAKDSLESDGP